MMGVFILSSLVLLISMSSDYEWVCAFVFDFSQVSLRMKVRSTFILYSIVNFSIVKPLHS